MTHQVDILRIEGDESEQAIVVNGVLCASDGIQNIEAFFAQLTRATGSRFVVTQHVVNVEDLDWTWPEVIAHFGDRA